MSSRRKKEPLIEERSLSNHAVTEESSLGGKVTLKECFVKFATAVVFEGKTQISLLLPEVEFHEATGRISFFDNKTHTQVYVWPSNIQFLRFQKRVE